MPTSFPSSVEVKKLNAKHPEYVARTARYQDLAALYSGEGIREYLRKRPSELTEVYTIRQDMISYTNLLSNIVGWYRSAMFNETPQITKKGPGKADASAGDATIPPDVQEFCDAFERNCDGAGGSLLEFWANVLECLVLYQTAYVMLDLPVPEKPAISRAEQESAGDLDSFLVLYEPCQVINWRDDAMGNLEWLVIHVRVVEQEFLAGAKTVDYWYFFDRQECALYQREVPADEKGDADDKATATLAAGYPRPHAGSETNRVPVRRVKVPPGLWLGNRIYRPLLNHLNLDNSLDFGLFQGNLAQLCIEQGENGARYETTPTPSGRVVQSEVGFHEVPHGGKMYYLEPDGNTFKISQDRIDSLEERIYKACYLQDQARTNASTPTQQSGVSKEQDKTPSRDAMSGLGDVLRPAMQEVYQGVLMIRGFEDITVDIRGFDFSDKASAQDMDLLEQGTIIEVNSVTFQKEVQKKAVRLQLADANPDLLTKIDKEIDANPTPAQLDEQRREEEQAAQLKGFKSSLASAARVQ